MFVFLIFQCLKFIRKFVEVTGLLESLPVDVGPGSNLLPKDEVTHRLKSHPCAGLACSQDCSRPPACHGVEGIELDLHVKYLNIGAYEL